MKEQVEIKNQIDPIFDPSEDRVLGVFKDEVHVLSHYHEEVNDEIQGEDCVLVIPKEEYLRIWLQWLDGKQEICKSYGHYCGVLGYTSGTEFEEINKINVTHFNPEADEKNEESWFTIDTPTRAFRVTKFDDYCDFEHG